MSIFWRLLALADQALIESAAPDLLVGFDAFCAGAPEQALKSAASVLQDNPNDALALVLSAEAFNFYSKPFETLELLRKASFLAQAQPSFELLVAEHLLNLDRPAEAQLCLQKILSQGDLHDSSPGLELLTRERLVRSLMMQSQLERAWQELEVLLPRHSHLFGRAAELSLKLDRGVDALDFALKHDQSERSVSSAKLLANCHFRCRDNDSYVHLLLKASQEHPRDTGLATLAAQAVFDSSSADSDISTGWRILSDLLLHHPDSPEAAFLNARQLLLDQNYEAGWQAYQSRLSLPNPHLYAACPTEWIGESPQGRNVVVVAEQGVGDILFFARFLGKLTEEATCVFLLCPSRLASLLRHTYPDLVVLEQAELACDLAGTDALWIPLASLPLRYGNTQSSIESLKGEEQLRIHPFVRKQWAIKLADSCSQNVRVGLSLTAGSSHQEYQQVKRDVPEILVGSLLVGQDVSVVDLQHRGELNATLHDDLVRFPGITRDLEQLCGLIQNLDILITSDQTNAFLGGMLGVPTLAIVPPNPHFMFVRSGASTPWFQSLHIVRSSRWADWSTCQSLLAQQLSLMLQECKQAPQYDQ
jgi:hypothetical protein